jgi:CubicO group peptidase (beta-lactamase class C family)
VRTGGSLDKQSLQEALDYSRQHNGLSLVILQDGLLVIEDYHNGHAKDSAHRLASGTKSFSGIILAALVQDGLVSSFDERVSDTITEWQTDAGKARITLRHLLSLSSGLDPGRIAQAPSHREALEARLLREPGEAFQYGPVPFQVFGEVVKRKLRGENALDYLQRRVLRPIGLEVTRWRSGRDGNPLMAAGAELRAVEWAKYGELLRNRGAWHGKQIVERPLVDELLRPSKANAGYGITLWLSLDPAAADGDEPVAPRRARRRMPSPGADRLPYRLFLAGGAGKQRLYVIDDLRLVVVRQGERSRFGDGEFLGILLRE